MSIKNENRVGVSQTFKRRVTRNKRSKYPSEVYGARLKLDDAKILNDYGIKHNLVRADVVRYALHQFAIKQQMSYNPNDPVRKLQEQIISEEIAHVKTRLDEISDALSKLTKHISDNPRQDLSSNIGSDSGGSPMPTISARSFAYFEQLFTEQQKTLEQTLVAATLALRLIVNYSVEPALSKLAVEEEGKLTRHFQAAEKGREHWSEATREVVKRTGKRILFELNFITKEEYEESLQEQ